MEKIINKWVQNFTVPYNTPFLKRIVKTFTANREGQNLDDMFGCRFIVYNGERRIILKNQNQKFDFYICSWDIHYDDTLNPLIYKLLKAKHIKHDSLLDDEIQVKINRLKEIEKFFKISFDIDFDKCDDDFICWEGDDWDDDAEGYFVKSDVYKKLLETLKIYLQYEYAPYRKYNPDFNPFECDEPNNDFDKIFEILTKEQIINALIIPYYDDNISLMSGESNIDELKKLLYVMDIDMIKLFILSRKHLSKETFIYVCNEFYNL